MRILSPDAINDSNKESHTGFYMKAFLIAILFCVVLFLFFGLVKIIIQFTFKHYYYALAIVGLYLLFRMKRRKKKAVITRGNY